MQRRKKERKRRDDEEREKGENKRREKKICKGKGRNEMEIIRRGRKVVYKKRECINSWMREVKRERNCKTRKIRNREDTLRDSKESSSSEKEWYNDERKKELDERNK